MPEINPMYAEGSRAMDSEIKRMLELEWPLEVSSEVLPEDMHGQLVGDIGAGPNPNLATLIESRGGEYIGVDRNFGMAKVQKDAGPERGIVQADILHLPFQDKKLDVLHTRFVLMNLPAHQRADAIRELARCGKKNIVMDYNWKKFQSENPAIISFIERARELTQLAGSDLDFGGKLKDFVKATLPENHEVEEKVFNQGSIKNYKTLAGLAKSLEGLAKNLENIEMQTAEKKGRAPNADVMKKLDDLALEMQKSAATFMETSAAEDQETVVPFTPPDIVAVTF